MGKKRPDPPPPAPGPFHQGFARLRERLPAGQAPPPAAEPEPPTEGTPPARAVVRLERKRRGGKEVTAVEKLGLEPAAAERWLDDARRALGCGGAMEEGALVLQGDQRKRVARWLASRGVAKVTVA